MKIFDKAIELYNGRKKNLDIPAIKMGPVM